MRLVADRAELPEALASARREALQAFGSDVLLLERALLRPRHVEIQVVADQYGRFLYLGERDCSIQRRHQKVIEEAPAPGVSPALRRRMGETAVSLAQAIGYHNVGTVEFLLDENGAFYFLEMNTRLQVEHPVTEMVTGIDLVAWQIAIAEGRPLPLEQADLKLDGHAVEARIYAENPAAGFLPVTGRIAWWQAPTGEGVRVDTGVQSGDVVTIHYDPMLAKIVAHGPDRETAVRRLCRALEQTVLLGLTTNIPFLRAVLQHEAFVAGQVDTGFLPTCFAGWQDTQAGWQLAITAVTLAQWLSAPQLPENSGYWRNNPNPLPPFHYHVAGNEEKITTILEPVRFTANQFRLTFSKEPDRQLDAQLIEYTGTKMVLVVDGVQQTVWLATENDRWWVHTSDGVVTLTAIPRLPVPHSSADVGGSLRAPMPGSVLAVLVEVGQRVQKGQPLMKLEAMKMEHTIRTAADGVVEAIFYAPGDTVEADAQLLRIRTLAEEDDGNISA
ncbi:MAG: biotin/lipoyl-binding protein [Chloroflexi bacterium]|nr:MAG: biotin/lipoyl-binding protein [Chloroflexota bacterium]